VTVMAGSSAAVPAVACAAFDQRGLDGAIIRAATVHAARRATLANEFAAVARASPTSSRPLAEPDRGRRRLGDRLARAEDRFRRREAHRSWRPAPQFC